MLYKQLKFPTSFGDLGIHEKSLIEALKIAPSIRDRYTILSKFSSDFIIAKFDEFKRRYIK
jgi:glycerol dehydrogenase-like iron-containing ADH family enzyme